MRFTKKGYRLVRIDWCFAVYTKRLSWDEAGQKCYAEEAPHSQLDIFVGTDKWSCARMVAAWLSFFDDEELSEQGTKEVDLLFEQTPAPIVQSDQKSRAN